MLNFKIFLLAALLLATKAFATKVQFLASYRLDPRSIVHVSGSAEYSDTDVDYIEHGIGDWSGYKYEARRTTLDKLVITNTRPVANQDAANTMLDNMIQLCNDYTGTG
ncbi:hypothetical protein K461DRAFT_267513 [Myriangium duriaei CBS 260.36]|uniref:Uncharacterized protein n=1 Tax=Myriangium duriaei CBS 260.36 TaxID=1168546 RepID=A0A9P4J5J9_9PEZI|nr:hypothetical protein K461DRAFT_267513 [Myriangium duriaei CBS 260.36]